MDTKKKRSKMNGNIGINKYNNYAPRKIRKNSGSTNHLTYLRKKAVNAKPNVLAVMSNP